MCFIFGRYTSGLGDYLGRKPILITSCIAFICSRLIYLSAQTGSGFIFGAILGGTFDCVYFTSLAWVCDLFPEGTKRSKRVGLFTGVVGGFAFVIGIPAGTIISQRGLELPFKIAIFGGLLYLFLLIILPVDDTLCLKPKILTINNNNNNYNDNNNNNSNKDNSICSKRKFPTNWRKYLSINFPISLHTYELIMKAKYPLDWLTNFLMHITSGILNLILIQYCLAVYGWSPIAASAGILSVGICLGIFAPNLLHRYDPIPLSFYTMIIFTFGHFLLTISGTGLSISPLLGIAGIICIAMGTSWVPALQTNILSQYGADIQVIYSSLH